jgi:GMP synthase (glutamine-hydrolysing)
VSSRLVILCIEHDRECPPGLFGGWLADAGCEVDVRRPYVGDALPESLASTTYGGLLVRGGPMGADDEAEHAWLGQVKRLVREARSVDLPTLGICLGHQLVASALGGTVALNPLGQQVGLIEVGWTEAARDDRLFGSIATPRRGVQWNDDLVTALPGDATILAATDRGEIQALRYAPRMWGVQLHPEVDVAALLPWAEADRPRHQTRGIDTDAVLCEVDAASVELDEAWRPLASGFGRLVAEHVAEHVAERAAR